MLRRFRSDPLVGNTLALFALLFAVGGTSAYAANEWTGENIVDESITGGDVRGKLGTSTVPAVNGTLGSADISGQAANAATSQPFVDGSLTGDDLANNSVIGQDIKDATLTGFDVSDNSLNSVDVAGLGPADISGLTGVNVANNALSGDDINDFSLSSPLLRNRTFRSATSVSDSTNTKSVSVACPTGTSPIGGGAQPLGTGFNATALRATVMTSNGWFAAAREVTFTSTAWSLQVYVICANT